MNNEYCSILTTKRIHEEKGTNMLSADQEGHWFERNINSVLEEKIFMTFCDRVLIRKMKAVEYKLV